MALENDFACFQCSSQWTDNHKVDGDVSHFLFALLALLNSPFSNVNIQVLFAELCCFIVDMLHVFLAVLDFYLGLDYVVFRLGVSNEIDCFLWFGLLYHFVWVILL